MQSRRHSGSWRQTGLNWSSQHLDDRDDAWVFENDSELFSCIGDRGDRQLRGVATGSCSGRRSLGREHRRSGGRSWHSSPSRSGGSATLQEGILVCPRSSPVASCCSPSAKTSRSGTRRVPVFATLPDVSAEARRRCRVSLVAKPRPALSVALQAVARPTAPPSATARRPKTA